MHNKDLLQRVCMHSIWTLPRPAGSHLHRPDKHLLLAISLCNNLLARRKRNCIMKQYLPSLALKIVFNFSYAMYFAIPLSGIAIS